LYLSRFESHIISGAAAGLAAPYDNHFKIFRHTPRLTTKVWVKNFKIMYPLKLKETKSDFKKLKEIERFYKRTKRERQVAPSL